jgi:hypothetical protein
VLIDLLDWELDFLAVLRSVSQRVAGVRPHPWQRRGRGEVDALERRCWSKGDGSAVISRLHRWNVVDLSSRQHGDVLRSTCHNDMCLAACCL